MNVIKLLNTHNHNGRVAYSHPQGAFQPLTYLICDRGQMVKELGEALLCMLSMASQAVSNQKRISLNHYDELKSSSVITSAFVSSLHTHADIVM